MCPLRAEAGDRPCFWVLFCVSAQGVANIPPTRALPLCSRNSRALPSFFKGGRVPGLGKLGGGCWEVSEGNFPRAAHHVRSPCSCCWRTMLLLHDALPSSPPSLF